VNGAQYVYEILEKRMGDGEDYSYYGSQGHFSRGDVYKASIPLHAFYVTILRRHSSKRGEGVMCQ
jgi:hypothetical protein